MPSFSKSFSSFNKCFTLLILSLSTFFATAQENVRFQLEAQGIATSNDHVPFWMRARQGGAAPLNGVSGSLAGFFRKDYNSTRNKTFDWGVGIEGRGNYGTEGSELFLVQANAKLKLGMFEIRGGRWRQHVGLVDTVLSSGAFAISGNALGVPQVQVGIPEFYALPFTKGWFSIKGTISHGWFGKTHIDNFYWTKNVNTYFHHKQFYGRFGNPNGKVQVYAGFNHQSFWGNEDKIFGSTFKLTRWQSYQSVLFGRNWAGSKVGNHAGSIDFGMKIRLKTTELMAYRQFFYEAGGLAHFSNILDGLNGLSLTNKKIRERRKQFLWEKALLEITYSGNQGGKLSSKSTPTGAENYYNHYLYANGWSYEGNLLGNPLFTMAKDARAGQTSATNQPIINNRLLAFHGGFTGDFGNSKIKILATYSQNYGTFASSGKPYRSPFHKVITPSPNFKFEPVNQLSTLVSFEQTLIAKNPASRLKSYLGLTLGFDTRGILDESAGVMVRYGIRL